MSDEGSASDLDFDGEDEEIDEDAAFSKEDWKKYGSWFEDQAGMEGSSEEIESAGEEDGSSEDMNDSQQSDPEEEDEDHSEGSEATSDEESGDNEEPGAHEELLSRIVQQAKGPEQRRSVVNEAVVEGEHSIAAASQAEDALKLEDLLQVTDLNTADRKQLQKLVSGSKVVKARLPKSIEQRQERKAAYVESSKEASKWVPLVATNRAAPTLRFTGDADAPRVTTAAGLASKHTAAEDYEQEIAEMLRAAGHHSTQAAAQVEDALGSTKLSAEEWQKRQDMMARSTALLFYQEQKSKRLKKIKSKAYHRHLKKKGAKEVTVDDEASLQAQAEEEEFARAQERLTLKHRNTSRWARRALKRGLSLASTGEREALQEQLRLSAKLRAKAATTRDGGESDASTDASDAMEGDEEGGGGTLTIKEKLELADALQQGNLEEVQQSLPKKGLFAMPFMQRALTKQRQEVALEAREILKAQALVDGLPGGAAALTELPAEPSARIVSAGAGKRNGKDDLAQKRKALEELEKGGSDEEGGLGVAGIQALQPRAPATVPEEVKRAAGATKAAPRKQNGGKASTSGKVEQQQEGRAEQSAGSAKQQEAANGAAPRRTGTGNERSAEGAEAGGAAAVAQESMQDILQAAFAGDDVVAEFEKDKAEAALESTAGVEDPSALPGWGAWAGKNSKEPEWLRKKRAKAEKEKKARLASRSDAKLKNVIICEKWDKKAAKLSVAELPFPYTQQEVYDKRLRVPLGRDMNTESSFRDLTRPSVIKQAGHVIQPLRRTSDALKAASEKKRSRASIVVVAAGAVKRNKKH